MKLSTGSPDMSSRFDLSEAESDFFAKHLSYDRCYAVTHLAHWLVTALCRDSDRNALVREFAEGGNPENLPEPASAIIRRHAPIAVVMNRFYRKLQTESRTTLYPVDEIKKVWPAAEGDRRR